MHACATKVHHCSASSSSTERLDGLLQTFLEQNEGPGLQHLALKSDDIFHTLRELRKRSDAGGFDFMPPASDAYYRSVLFTLALCTLILSLHRDLLRCPWQVNSTV